jgi:SAM-dependent methyltransferase
MKFSKINERNRKQWFYDKKDDYILLRKHMFFFAKEICNYIKDKNLKILEVGPAINGYKEKYDEFSTKIIQDTCLENKIYYKTLDIIPDFGCNYTGTIEDLSFINEKFDIVILLGIIEHVQKIHLVPDELKKITTENGILFINTPYMFKIHGPTPDCWRISPFGFSTLFEGWNLSFNTYPVEELGKNTFPLSINTIASKTTNAETIISGYKAI